MDANTLKSNPAWPKVTVIVINWNGRHFLDDCLRTLLAQAYPNFEVILADNGSRDGSVDHVRTAYSTVKIMAFAENLGFAEGNNRAILASEGEYVITLNNDTWVEPGWLAALVAAAESDPGVGMVASKMIFARNPTMVNSTGICMDPVAIAWDRNGGDTDDPSDAQIEAVFGPCAGAALYRRAMLDEIGLFDVDFFAYLEDVDLAWRAQLCGWRALYTAQARVFHIHSGTSKEGSIFKSRLLGRNKIWTIIKNYPNRFIWFYLPLIIVYDLAAVLYSGLGRRDMAAFSGRLQGLRKLPIMMRKRRALRTLRRQLCENRSCDWQARLDPLIAPWRIPARYRHLALIDLTRSTELD